MPNETILQGSTRDSRGKEIAKKMRRDGVIPAVLYGGQKDSVVIALAHDDLIALLKKADTTRIFSLRLDKKKETQPVMIHDMQVDPVTHTLLHIDLIRVVYGQTIHVAIPLRLEGVAPGIKMGGILDFIQRELNVECMPSKIPPTINVDVSTLEIGDHVNIKDVHLDEEIKVLDDPHNIVVRVAAPKIVKEEVEEEAVEEEELLEPEVVGQKREEPEA